MATNRTTKHSQGRSNRVRGGALSVLLSGDTDNGKDVADWESVDPVVIVRLIATFARLGGATRFGYSRDGGAYSLGIYLEDDRETLYFKPYEDVTAKLIELIERVNVSMNA